MRLSKALIWLLLALPAAWMLAGWWQGDSLPMDLIEPTGDTAVRLMILAMLPGPLAEAFGAGPVLRAWLAARRYLGVAAFLYALLHLAAYALDMGLAEGLYAGMVEELALPPIWTGWLALALLVPLALTSNAAAVRLLRRGWKRVQRLAYPALALAFAHWLLLDWSWPSAALHAAPLILAWTLRALRRAGRLPRSLA